MLLNGIALRQTTIGPFFHFRRRAIVVRGGPASLICIKAAPRRAEDYAEGHAGKEIAMSFKDILVTLDAAPPARGRIELAAALAKRCKAHLVGLHISTAAEAQSQRGYFNSFDQTLLEPLYRDFAEQMQLEAEASRTLFKEAVSRHGVSAEWRQAAGQPSRIAALHGRYADLLVLGQLDPDDIRGPLLRPLPEQVALAIGRPVLVVPYVGSWDQIGRRVLVGWDASREATRAVNDAMPLLETAETVTVLTIDPVGDATRHGEVPGADIALHLARHGIKATVEATVSGDISAGNVLLSRASDLAADLLVIGAYGHSRVRELVLGRTTRTILESMTLPVLMAH
jgi:nucleotide-binding universal stress UspA family protein